MSLLSALTAAWNKPGRVTFCDGCGQICDSACRAGAARHRTLVQVSASRPIRL